ncbi:phage minor capsid protein [Streptococcus suis]|uniref:phage minor capsid protein n=1 Tax=Streptococcus suis TaxID=1307 RepID=UPI003D366229|nr:minor capsid protein [Streptococcus suis]MCK3937247.1 minor capsid protein [Streptococcus suis]
MAYDVSKAFQRIEEELLSSMIRNLKRHKAQEAAEGFEWEQWQVAQLRELQRFKRANAKKYGKEFAKINSRIASAIQVAHREGMDSEELAILEAIRQGLVLPGHGDGLTGSFFGINERKLNALLNAIEYDMKVAEHAILRYTDDQYRRIIFDAQVVANTGAVTYEKAIDMATKDFLSRGITCIQYKNGTLVNIVSYAEMAVRTATKRAYLMGEGLKRQEWGISTVILNKRTNACPLCMPFEGKVLIDDVWSGGKASDGPYPLLSSAMAAGLYHPRCKDKHTTYFPGISSEPEKTFTRSELEDIKERQRLENRTQYAKRQEQRFGRLTKFSLDPENVQHYSIREQEWKKQTVLSRKKLETFEKEKGYNLDKSLDNLDDEVYNYIKGEDNIQKAIADFGKISDEQADLIYEERRGDGGGYIKTINSFNINRALRPGGSMDILTDDDWDVMAALDEVIESNVTPYNIRGLRKVSYDWVTSFISNTELPPTFDNISDLSNSLNTIKGHSYFELAYSSVSIDPDKNVFENRRVWLDIEVPKGTNAYMSSNLMESEFILGTGTTFELKGSSVAQDKYGDLLKITLRVKEK